MSRPITYGFGNVGRVKKGSSTRVDLDALHALKNSLPGERAVVFLCEINEGDDNNEMALVRQVFKGWHLYAGRAHQQVREPILTTPDFAKASMSVKWLKNTGVEHWSPQRSRLTVTLHDEPISLIGMHYPAGAHGQGDRPEWAKPLLNNAWDIARGEHEATVARLHHKGRNVVYMMDTNDYDFARMGDITVTHEHTDWGRVKAAKGFDAHFNDLAAVPFHIDSHDGQRMRGSFLPAA